MLNRELFFILAFFTKNFYPIRYIVTLFMVLNEKTNSNKKKTLI